MMKSVVEFSPAEELRYQELRKLAASDPLAFRKDARHAAEQFPREMRRDVEAAHTRTAPIFALFADWTRELAPDLETLEKKAQTKTLQHAIAKQLNLPGAIAEERAHQLVERRRAELLERFLDLYQYGARGRAYEAARQLFGRPVDVVADIHVRCMDYTMHQMVAHELGFVISDPYAPLLKRRRLARKERRQIKHYNTGQAKRLDSIRSKQQVLSSERQAIIGRILALNLDTILALDAYRQYKKRLDALKPASRTPAKTLSLFTAATKSIRDNYAKTLTDMSRLSDLQRALEEVDNVLVEIFDMTDSERNTLMVRLKEYRELEREAMEILHEQNTNA